MRRVAVFTPDYHPGNTAVLQAFADGVPGARVVPDTAYVDCDVAVIFGMVKRSFTKSHRKALIIKAHGTRPLLVVERGFVHRDRYWSAGWGGINGGARFENRGMPSDRWAALNVILAPWRVAGDGPYLVCGQVPWDVSVQHTNHVEWVQNIVRNLKAYGRDVRFRPHPLAVQRGVNYAPGCPVSTATLAEDLSLSAAVVTYNSNTGVDAVIAGVPTAAYDRGSMVWDVAAHSHKHVRTWDVPREQWVANLAYTQWTLDEMRAGLPWRHLTRGLS